ncbi:uncharacterized protein LOC108906586 [Anoplophora glabripennis]|uniref:uncharacterized protein LOC108906586 n=1 Tax=Anoplophora glabripennis TaxID=217634 RepID=UPI0008738BD1|nr:uncharacterized protein LOC108906586 [Anoplophora glabripennis]
MTLSRSTSTLVLNYFNRSIFNSLNSSKHNLHNSAQNSLTFKRFNSSVCWKCGKERKNSQVFCETCNAVQAPLEKDNYFKVFGLEENFDIDQQYLKNKFRKLQSMLHPDKFSNKTDEEQHISAEYSSLLNKAYSSLHTPLKRAEHLLNLRGEQIGEEQAVDDPAFLMEIMELNEEMESAGNDKEKLKALNTKNKMELERISKEVDECFRRNDIRAAKKTVIKLKYFSSLGSRINGVLRELGETD